MKLTSCDGCQLTILDLEDELLAITERFDIVDFPEATSARSAGPYDVLFVEGSISDPDQLERIHDLRARTRMLVVIGACATAGGIQAMRNWGQVEDWASSVYPDPSLIRVLDRVTPGQRPREGRRRAARLPDLARSSSASSSPRSWSVAGRSFPTRRSASSASGAATRASSSRPG